MSWERLYRIHLPKEYSQGDVVRGKVAALGDVNADGSADFVLGIPGTLESGGNSGLVRVYNGKDGALIREHSENLGPEVGGSLFGSVTAGLGDIDGDGTHDYAAVKGPAGGPPAEFEVGVSVWSGADGTEIVRLNSPGDTVLTGVARGTDWNGDQVPDYLATLRPTGQSFPIHCFVVSGTDEVHMSVYSGRTFQPILRIHPTFPVTRSYSEEVDVLGDINGARFPELLIGVGRRVSFSHPATFRGYVEVVSVVPPGPRTPNLHTIKRVELANPLQQRWQLDWFSKPGRFYNVEVSPDLRVWFPGALPEPLQTPGTSGRVTVGLPLDWKRGYFRVVELE